jgi:hypothetical protein
VKNAVIAPHSVLFLFLAAAPAPLFAQPLPDPRVDAAVGVGYARTWDDEGSIGNGSAIDGSVAVRVTPRIALGLRLERIHNFREAGYGALVFEGDSTLAAGEAQFRFGTGTVQPIVRAGYGLLDYSGSTTSGPPQNPPFLDLRTEPIPTVRTPHQGRAGVLTAGADVDVFVSRHVSIRPAATFHLAQTSDDSMPWMIWRAGAGIAVHW